MLALIFATGVVGPFVDRHLRAASLLARLAGSNTRLARYADVPIVEENMLLHSRHGPFRARIYRPRDGRARRGVVLCHGVHFMGIDEPRLQPFARQLARTGFVVMTPELAALADYRVLPSSVDEMRVAARTLAAAPSVRAGGVVLLGLSFAGGLALLAASDPATRPAIAGVVAIGGHNDLARVSRFLATDRLETPDGIVAMRAHDYGLVVYFYAHAELFVHGEQLLLFRDALRLILHVQRDDARHAAAQLDAPTRELFDAIDRNDKRALSPLVTRSLPAVMQHARLVSPSTRMALLRGVPIVLIHGAHDDVMPPTEPRANARELRAITFVHELLSPAFKHVTVEGTPTAWQQWQIVHAMSLVMGM